MTVWAEKGAVITFILIFAFVILLFGAWMIANEANQRKPARQADVLHVHAQETGSGAPAVHRPSGPK